MRILTILLFYIVLNNHVHACTFIPLPFCYYVLSWEPDHEIFIGEVTEIIPNGVRFEIKETLRGDQGNGIITIWDDEPIDCNGLFVQSVGRIAGIGEEVILSTEKIDSIINPWDQMGDYRTPLITFAESILKIRTDSVHGFISGGLDLDSWIFSIHLDEFKERIFKDLECPSFFVSTKEEVSKERFEVFPNPTRSIAYVHLLNNDFREEDYLIRIYTSTGVLFRQQNLTNMIDMSNLPNGIYYLVVINPEGSLIGRKRVVVVE